MRALIITTRVTLIALLAVAAAASATAAASAAATGLLDAGAAGAALGDWRSPGASVETRSGSGSGSTPARTT